MSITKKTVVCRDLEGKEYKVSTEKLAFRPSVYGIVIKNKKVLLSKQFDGYDFPGGGIELGETIEEALQREVWEETGLTVTPGGLVHVQNDFFKPPFGNSYKHTILLYYLCTNPKGTISTENFDIYEQQYAQKAEWVPLQHIRRLKFYNPIKNLHIIKQAQRIRNK